MKRNILETVGTPLVRVSSPDGAIIAAKLESFNPGCSAKDRPAINMIRAAERTGDLTPGGTIVEATSGNTGIGLAMVCAARGYQLVVVMPASKSEERRRLMAAYGAEIELIEGDMEAAIERANEIAEDRDAVQMKQFSNQSNPESHYRTTAEEIIADTQGLSIDALVVAVGTGGTITGVGRRLREAYPDLEIVAVEPEENPVLSTGNAGDDEFQGMGPGFVSDILDVDLIDSIETVSLPDAEAECRRLAQAEGILVGQSSGAAMIAARRVANRIADPAANCEAVLPQGGEMIPDGGPTHPACPLVVTIFPDSGERYLTAGTFDA